MLTYCSLKPFMLIDVVAPLAKKLDHLFICSIVACFNVIGIKM